MGSLVSRRCARVVLATVACCAGVVPGVFGASVASAAGATPTSVAAGTYHACAVLSDTTVECWGQNSGGANGDGTTTAESLPVSVQNATGTAALTGVTQIATANDSCALLGDGTVRCWGGNAYGQLGIGTTSGPQSCGGQACSPLPVEVKNTDGSGPLTNVTQLALGGNDACAVLADTSAVCWGDNMDGQVGNVNAPLIVDVPVVVKLDPSAQPLTGIASMSVGGTDACAVLTNGTARCWGYNFFGQVGDGTRQTRGAPTAVMNSSGSAPLSGVAQIAVGANVTCALMSDQTVQCWGRNSVGQIGDGTTAFDQLLPTAVVSAPGSGGLSGVSRVTAGGDDACALLTDGTVRCWGDNGFLELGDGLVVGPDTCGQSFCGTTPQTVEAGPGQGALSGVSAISTAGLNTCALLNGGAVRCWGHNADMELGDGTTVSRCFPAQVGVVGPAAQAPTIPTGVTAVRGVGQATVHWALQTGDCGTPVTSFNVTASPGGTHLTVSGWLSSQWQTSVAFYPLTPGVAYTFTVTATDDVGTSAPSVPSNAVTPLGGPSAPTAVTVTPGNGTATIHWTAPTHTNGSAITGYSITPYQNGVGLGPHPFKSLATTETIARLINGRALTFTVAAINGYGTGTPSAASKPVIIGVPRAPTGIKATKVGAGKLKLTFNAALNDGAAISHYTATCTSTNHGVAKTAVGKASPIIINGLTTGKTYTCTVTATNGRGTSPASTPSTPTKP